MNILIVAALLLVVVTLVFGVASMARHGTVGHHTSEQWMTLRVAAQALALGLMVAFALLA